MSKTWFASDHHLGHANIIKFESGRKEFSTIEEHDDTIIERHNKLVRPEDRVYFMGDVAINRKSLPLIARMNGRKKLIKGNHDIFKLKDYLPYFEDILSYKVYVDQGLIVSHIPIYAGQMETKARWKFNAHGHTHRNKVQLSFKAKLGESVVKTEGGWYDANGNYGWPDDRYINLCLEHTNYEPVLFQELCDRIGWINPQGT